MYICMCVNIKTKYEIKINNYVILATGEGGGGPTDQPE